MDASSNDDDAWWLDIGASNHMTGSRCKFKEMIESIRGHVKLGDGSTALIEGKGSVLVECHGGELLLTEVYFVPSLSCNVISLGKLSEDGHQIVLDRMFLWIRDMFGKVLLKVKRSPNRLYKVLLKTPGGAGGKSLLGVGGGDGTDVEMASRSSVRKK